MSELIIKLNNEIVALEQTILISGKNIEATVEMLMKESNDSIDTFFKLKPLNEQLINIIQSVFDIKLMLTKHLESIVAVAKLKGGESW